MDLRTLLANPQPYYGQQLILRGYFILVHPEMIALIEPAQRKMHILLGIQKLPAETAEQLFACRSKLVEVQGYVTHTRSRGGEALIISAQAMVGVTSTLTSNDFLAPFSEPAIAISPPDASGTFRFSFCDLSNVHPLLNRIEVLPAGQRVGTSPHASYCVWKKERGVSLSSEWKYGSVAQGAAIIGACPSFQRGASYEVLVDGSGSGSLEFEVTAGGDAKVVKPSCPERLR